MFSFFRFFAVLFLPLLAVAQNLTISYNGTTLTIPVGGNVTVTPDAEEDRLYAIAVTSLRPDKLKWKLGNFGTFTPTERIYGVIVNLCRMGSDTSNYTSGLHNRRTPLDTMAIPSGASVVAHGSFSVLCYVTETDVAAVTSGSAKRTWNKMQAYLWRDATITHYQARASGGAKTGSSPTTITPGTYGSIVIEMEGQGYECDLVPTVSSVAYVAPSLAPKNAITTGGVSNEWVHAWWGRVPVMMPIAATMDSQSFAWAIKVYSAQSGYEGLANARVADLPSWWGTDQ